VVMFVPDWESMQHEVEQEPENDWTILKAHLDGLLEDLKKRSENGKLSAKAAGELLADNLFNNLCHLYPSFGPLKS